MAYTVPEQFMQTLIDIPEEYLSKLDKLSEDRQTSRDEIVRTAILTYLQSQTAALEDSFDLWSGTHGDGMEYQQHLRSEW